MFYAMLPRHHIMAIYDDDSPHKSIFYTYRDDRMSDLVTKSQSYITINLLLLFIIISLFYV